MAPLRLTALLVLYVCVSTADWNCSVNLTDLPLISAGSFGAIYRSNNFVIKAFSNNKEQCKKAKKEYKIHNQIYNTFNNELLINSTSEIAQLASNYIQIASLNDFCPFNSSSSYSINDAEYGCYYIMSLLEGISISKWKTLLNEESDEFKKLDPDWINQVGDHDEYKIFIQLTMNGVLNEFMGREFFDLNDKINENNLPRGYYLNDNDHNDILNKLIESHDLAINKDEIKNIIGFIHGWIYKKAEMIPVDIEIALGIDIDDGKWKIILMDFDQFIKIKDDYSNDQKIKFPQFWDVCKRLHADLDKELMKKKQKYIKQAKNKNIEFEKRVEAIISSDFYADIIDDVETRKGWIEALNIAVNNEQCEN